MRFLAAFIHLFKPQIVVNREMACSRYEYVKSFEQDDRILPNVWITVRIDGKKFHKFSKIHCFEKPNDENALNLMNTAAIAVMSEFRDIMIAFGQSDEYSFIFRRDTKAFNRRASKLLTYVTSLFTSSYVLNWPIWMPQNVLSYAPCFDGRIILYPSHENLRDYLCWRQADVHVNNLYNTAFWNLVINAKLSNQQAEEALRGTMAADKNELLFSKFGINYNNLKAIYRKGTVLLRKRLVCKTLKDKRYQVIIPMHDDMIGNQFWHTHAELIGKYEPGEYECDSSILEKPLIAAQLQRYTNKSFEKKESVSDVASKT